MSFHGEGRGGGGGEGRGGSRRKELRPEDIPDKAVSLRRIGRLFVPYRVRLGLLLGLIVFGSILSVASPFLLREAVDKGIVGHDLEQLTWIVAGMIALAIVNGVIGVAQTWISNQVGQRVMHDLARRGVRAPAADVAGVLHAHALGRGAGAGVVLTKRRSRALGCGYGRPVLRTRGHRPADRP